MGAAAFVSVPAGHAPKYLCLHASLAAQETAAAMAAYRTKHGKVSE